jgi:hypothetical protein
VEVSFIGGGTGVPGENHRQTFFLRLQLSEEEKLITAEEV